MTKEDIFVSLKEILTTVKPSVDQTTVTNDSSLVQDLGIDSLSILLISIAIENKFNFTFNGVPQFKTVGEVVEYIADKTGC